MAGEGSHLHKSSSDSLRNRIIPVGARLRHEPEEDLPGRLRGVGYREGLLLNKVSVSPKSPARYKISF